MIQCLWRAMFLVCYASVPVPFRAFYDFLQDVDPERLVLLLPLLFPVYPN